jgi:hypothetical protein
MKTLARISASVAFGFTLVAVAPSSAAAQAICSAPHSSPTLSQSGAIRTLPQGAFWLQASFYGQNATESFNPLGDRQAFLGGSKFDTRSIYFTGAVGLVEGLEIWAQVPVHDLRVHGTGGESESRGVGDIRTAVRVSPALFGLELPVALRAGLKIPGSEFPIDATELPLTEGQRDFELSLESGLSSLDFPVYAVAWAGYRWRSEDTVGQHQPGDEAFAHVAVGGAVGAVHLELGFDALWGDPPIQQGLTLDSASRRLYQLLPTIGTDVGPGRLELTTPIPLSGRNLPSDPGVSVGYRAAWGLGN